MTTSTVQPKWALIGVRVCAVYLVAWIVPAWLLLLSGLTNKWLFLTLPTVWSLYAALRLWRLSDRGQLLAGMTFFGHIVIPLGFLFAHDVTSTMWLTIVLLWLIAVFWIFFLSRSAVEALFQNQKSTINNQKSPNA